MKKILFSILSLCFIFPVSIFSQKADPVPPKSTKASQNTLYNNVNIAYGIGTIYLFNGPISHDYDSYGSYSSQESDVNSNGSLMVGYDRMLNKIIMIGFSASYLNCYYHRVYTDSYSSQYLGTATFNENLLTGITRFTFNYVNKPIVRVYSSAGMGITVDLSNVQGDLPGSVKETKRKILFAGQVTFMGVRFGRAFGGFCEFGIGTNSLISAGFNYQFAD